MMKHLLTIVLCLTTLTGLAQEEKIKKSEWWNGNPSYAVPIREVNVTAGDEGDRHPENPARHYDIA